MSKFKAVIFDMDGLLIDSMAYWLKLDKQFFAGLGLEFDNEIIRYLTGRSVIENVRYLITKFNLSQTEEEIMEKRSGRFIKVYKNECSAMPGAETLLRLLKDKGGCRQAIASGAPLDCIKIVVNRFNWQGYFEHLISADHVNQIGKPDPAIYVYAARQLGLAPGECTVFEDAENGVIAAKQAGMNCIAVVDERWSFGDFSQADLIVDSLVDDQVYKFLQI